MVQRIKKTNSPKKHHFFLYFILFLIICAAVVLGLVFLKPTFEKKEQGSDSSSATTDQSQQTDDKQSSESATAEEKKAEEIKPEAEKSNPQYEGEDPNTSASLTGIINYVGVSDGALVVRVSIEQNVSGTCTFTLSSPSGKTVAGSGTITSGPSSAFCSFSTPATESGTWKISVTATSSDKQGIITGEASI